MRRFLVWLILTIIWILFIFYNSSRNAVQSSVSSGKILAIAEDFLQLFKIKINPITLSWLIRKGAHFIEFFILSCLTYKIIRTTSPNKENIYTRLYSYIIAPIFCLLIAVIDEIIQFYIPGRHCSAVDVLIDFSGGLFATIIIFLFNLRRKRCSINL